MSLLDLASLVLAPTATKEGKVYSAIPDTGDGDMTFTRGSAATRVNSAGLIEKERANLSINSQNGSAWSDLGVTINSTTAEDFLGGNDAVTFTANGGGAAYVFSDNTISIANGVVYTGSVYVKNIDANYAQLTFATSAFGSSQYRNFDLTSGTLGTGLGIDAKIEDVGGGWYRLSITALATASVSTGALVVVISPSASATRIQAATTGQTLTAFGIQLEQGLVATDYIETTTTAVYEGITDDVPRVDYSGGGCPSLLLEPQRTNLLTQSEYFGAWENNTNTSLTANAIQSPSGFVDAYKMSAGTSNARQSRTLDVAVNGSLAFSTYAKKGEYSVVQLTDALDGDLYANFDLENGVLGNYNDCTPSIEDAGNGWYRCIITWTSIGNINKVRISIAESTTQGRLVNFAGNGSDGIYIWGAMLEAGSYSTSYLPTYGTSTTRVADSCSKTGISELIGQSEGVVFVEFDQNLIGQSATRRIFALNDGTTSNRITAYISAANKIDFYVRNSGGDLFYDNSTSPIGNEKGVHKIACAYKDEDYAVYMDGALIISGTGTAGTIPACSRFDLGNQIGANDLYEPINQAILFPTRLTNDQLEELTK